MSSRTKSLIALGCIFGGALLGIGLSKWIPAEYRTSDSKEVVRLGMGLVVTTVAMALGLLVGSAKSFYDLQNTKLAEVAATFVMLDRILAQYGPEGVEARASLRTTLGDMLGESARKGTSEPYVHPTSGALTGDVVLNKIWVLSPKNDDQRFLKQQCLNLIVRLGEIRWLMFAQSMIPFPKLLLTMLISWVIVLFVSFGILAPRNPVVMSGLLASAGVVCGAILLILEMYHPESTLIRVSDAPLRAAMETLGR